MGWEIWRKVRRFLLVWAGILLVLLVAAAVVYRNELAAALYGDVEVLLTLAVMVGIVLMGILWLVRPPFP